MSTGQLVLPGGAVFTAGGVNAVAGAGLTRRARSWNEYVTNWSGRWAKPGPSSNQP